MDLSGNWTVIASRALVATPSPNFPGAYIPIPPQFVPGQPGQYELTAPVVAVEARSTAVRSTWYLGCGVRIESRLPSLSPPGVTDRWAVPINRGALILYPPDWALSGYQLILDIPYWYTEIYLEVATYDGPPPASPD